MRRTMTVQSKASAMERRRVSLPLCCHGYSDEEVQKLFRKRNSKDWFPPDMALVRSRLSSRWMIKHGTLNELVTGSDTKQNPWESFATRGERT